MERTSIMQARKFPDWCGLAILSELSLRLTDAPRDQQWFMDNVRPDIDGWGTSQFELVYGVGLVGLEGKWVQDTLEMLCEYRKQGQEVVLSWMSGPNTDQDGHYGLLELSEPDRVKINDPEWIGMIKEMDRSVFEEIWFDIDENGVRQERWALVVRRPPRD